MHSILPNINLITDLHRTSLQQGSGSLLKMDIQEAVAIATHEIGSFTEEQK